MEACWLTTLTCAYANHCDLNRPRQVLAPPSLAAASWREPSFGRGPTRSDIRLNNFLSACTLIGPEKPRNEPNFSSRFSSCKLRSLANKHLATRPHPPQRFSSP